MTYVVSGYFATFHNGHKEYIDSVINLMNENDKLIVIVANPLQFKQKYKDFCPTTWKVVEPIFSFLKDKRIKFEIMRAIDRDMTVKETLRSITEKNKEVCFVKDGGEYNKENLPEKEVENINFLFLNNPKISNASEILNIEKK